MSSPSASKPSPLESAACAALTGLNLEQREAVLTTEGPVLIIAGAGTGKTRVIAHRIAYLLQTHPDLSPANVVALTFSRKAAQEMLERVEGLLGGYADELGIFTFHGFCHRFLQDHAVTLGLPVGFRLLDRVEPWIFFRKLLPELRLVHYGNLSDPTGCIEGFLRFISRAKDELVGPGEYASFVRELSDAQERSRGEEVERAYRIYQSRMKAAGQLDFGDLVVETVKALREQTALLAQLRSTYRYILVDEFQDTNVAQIAFLRALAGPRGNLCVVGDDDQAIYRFRGASFASFLLMKEAFPDVKTIRLTQNYRSVKRVLSAAQRLIRHNEPDRYDPTKRLWSQGDAGSAVELLVCTDEGHEADVAVQTIQDLIESQPPGERRLDRIAVLYRAHAHRNRLVEALRLKGIPFAVQSPIALFDQEEIQELVAFCRVANDPSDSVSLFRLLSHPMWGIPTEELLVMTRTAKERETSLWDLLQHLHTLAVEPPTKKAVAQLLSDLQKIRRGALRQSVKTLIPLIAEETFLRTIFRAPPTESGEPLIFLGRFLALTYRYAQNHPEEQKLSDFLWYLDSYCQAGGDPAGDAEEPVGNRVNLMTIHQAKGLEFDWVILLGMVQGRFPSRKRPEPIPFPVSLMKEPLPAGDYHLQEERRLCYVACTRARKGLSLLTQERAYHRPSIFVREMTEGAPEGELRRRQPAAGPPLSVKAVGADPAGSLAVEREVLELLRGIRGLHPGDEAGFSAAIERIKECALRLTKEAAGSSATTRAPLFVQEKFSFTQMETYRYCPMKYQYSYVYQIPTRPTPQMMLGNDLHQCLEAFFRKIMEGVIPSMSDLLESFHSIAPAGRYGQDREGEEYRRLGMDLLAKFYEANKESLAPPLWVEKSFLLKVADAWVRGVVDRIDPLPKGGVEIIDYKSGRPKEEATADEQLQLRLYALAAQEVFGLEAKKVSFYYLRSNEKLSFPHDPGTLSETKARISELIGMIRSGDFTPDPSPRKCRWCDFRSLCPASLASPGA